MSEQYRGTQQERDVTYFAIALLLALLIFPALAILRIGRILDLRYIAAYAFLLSIMTGFLYRHDKSQAQSGGWRTPESSLHIAELLGGWPGAFLAQRVVRHKIFKTSYQIVFWMIITLHEFIAFDFVQQWHYSREFLRLLHG